MFWSRHASDACCEWCKKVRYFLVGTFESCSSTVDAEHQEHLNPVLVSRYGDIPFCCFEDSPAPLQFLPFHSPVLAQVLSERTRGHQQEGLVPYFGRSHVLYDCVFLLEWWYFLTKWWKIFGYFFSLGSYVSALSLCFLGSVLKLLLAIRANSTDWACSILLFKPSAQKRYLHLSLLVRFEVKLMPSSACVNWNKAQCLKSCSHCLQIPFELK